MNELERENKRMALVSVFHVIREKYCLSIVLLSKNDFSKKKKKLKFEVHKKVFLAINQLQ